MKTVNLLPQWYLQQSRGRKLLRLHVVAMVLIASGMWSISWLGRQKLARDEAKRDGLAKQVESLPDAEAELRAAEADLHRLEELRLARKELGNTVPMSAVVQQLRNEMTAGMALSNVAIDVRSEPVKGSGFVGDPHNPPKYHEVAHLNILGIAPNDRQITQFIEEISVNPLFAGVTLDFTRTSTLKDYSVRKFQIQLDMDLERLTTEDISEPVATAAPASPVMEKGDGHE
jgi:hypothetical protein